MASLSAAVEPGLLGCRVRLTAEEGEYTGTVHAVRDGAVTLTGVTFNCGDHNEPVRGVQKFLRGDVRRVLVLEAGPDEPAPQPEISPAARPRNDKMVMERASGDARTQRYADKLVDDSLLLSQIALGDSDDDDEAGDSRKLGDNGRADSESDARRVASPPPLLPRSSGFAVIDAAGEELTDAVDYLLKQEHVGLSGEGVLLGRAGELSLVTVACSEFTFVFDMLTLGGAGVAALTPLLQSHAVLKIVHDCRALADLFAHQHSVRLANVFDTQVAEVYLYNQSHGKAPAYVTDVAHALVRRLGLLPRQVFLPRYRLERMRQDQQVWLKRPLTDSLLDGAIKNAVYLRELRHVQVERMFARYVRCVDAYLGAVRDGDDEDANNAPFESHRLPVEVQRILDEPPKPHALASSDPDNPRLDVNVLGGAGAPVGFTRNVWTHSAVK